MARAAAVLILPSPLLPESTYQPLVAALAELSTRAAIAPSGLAPGQDARDLVARWADRLHARTVLVPHSNAGCLAPSVRALGSEAMPVVFLDAALPPPAGTTTLAPPEFRARLAALAGGSPVLPPWTRWWSREEFGDVVPEARFDELDRECPRLPLSYFDVRLTVPDGWVSGPNAYLAFGGGYAGEFGFAAAHQWPRSRIEAGHLHFLHDPGAVASRVVGLIGQLSDA